MTRRKPSVRSPTTSVSPQSQTTETLDAFTFAMSEKQIRGSLFGSCKPRNDIPMLLDLYRNGQLMLEELITTRYALEDINQGFADMEAGSNLRGVIVYGEADHDHQHTTEKAAA